MAKAAAAKGLTINIFSTSKQFADKIRKAIGPDSSVTVHCPPAPSRFQWNLLNERWEELFGNRLTNNDVVVVEEAALIPPHLYDLHRLLPLAEAEPSSDC